MSQLKGVFGVRMWTGFRVLCTTAAVIAAACSDVFPAPESGAAPAAATTQFLEPGGFSIAPRSDAIRAERFDPETGSLERLGLSLRAQIAKAWGVRAVDLQFRVELPAGLFDVRARPEEGGREGAEALIRGGLSEHLGLVVEKGIWQGDILALHLVLSGTVPGPVEEHPEGEAAESVRRVGEYRVAAAPISDLVDFLRTATPTPVVDATGLEENYDIAIEWDAAQGGRALRAALRDAGFELRRERGVLDRWMVRKAD
jgi:uncharacterized protein (TIGR03435 family)